MSSWLFIFGRTHDLSLSELEAFADKPVTRLTPDVARGEGFLPEDNPAEFLRALGGTVKIAREKGRIQKLAARELLPYLEGLGEQLTFGISVYGSTATPDTETLRQMKEALLEGGIRARYVLPHDGNVLTSVVITKQHIRELVIVAGGDGFIVGETTAVQDFQEWNERDYGRPYADPKAGMLPPKVARMAVNLAKQSKVESHLPANATHQALQAGKSKVLLDPFCGMGTILGEAFLAGWQVIGSDQSEEVIGKAKKNIEWLVGLTRPRPVIKFFVSDATHVAQHIANESVDAIVTEPFMGPASGGNGNVKNIMKGLEKLYIGCLRDWHHILKPGGKVVIALPEYAVGGRIYFVKNVIDRCEIIGYTVTLGPLSYSRPQAIVKRKFFVLTKK